MLITLNNVITLMTLVNHSSVVREAVTAVVAQSMHNSNNLYFAVDTSIEDDQSQLIPDCTVVSITLGYILTIFIM